MTDYIKRADAIEAFDPSQRQDWYTPWIVETLGDLPSADVTPVRHGHWIKISPAGIYECSKCGQNVMTSDIEAYVWCHGCGARMDGDDNEID